MAAGSAAPEHGGFDHLREHSIGLPQVLFQSITHMAPGGRRRVLDLHLRARRAAGAAALGRARTDRLPLRRDRDRTAREAPAERRRPLHVRRPLARPVGGLPRRLALHRLPAARRAVPLPRVRLGDARRVQHERRLALERPVGGLGAPDGGDRLPAHLPRRPPLDDGRRDPRRVRDRRLRARSRSGSSSRRPAT